jgi:hypothetical protein
MTREEELQRQARDALAKDVFISMVAHRRDNLLVLKHTDLESLAVQSFEAAEIFWQVANQSSLKPKIEPNKKPGPG